MKFDLWVWHKKKVTAYIPSFPGRVLGLGYAPLKFSIKSLLWLLLLNRLMEFLEFKLVNSYGNDDVH